MKRWLWRLLLGSLIGITAGCPLSIEEATPAASGIGEACARNDDCPVGICNLQLPGGYCSAPCSESLPCPDDAVCVGIVIFGLPTSSCWLRCEGQEQCTRPGYSCVPAPRQQGSVCNSYED